MRCGRRWWIVVALAGAAAAGGWTPAARAGAKTRRYPMDPAAKAAAGALLRQARAVSPRGPEHAMLRALGHLRAPSLRPMFQKLAANPHPALRLHGLLGAAALSRDHRLTLGAIAGVRDPEAVARLVAAALDDHLLGLDDAASLMTWKGLGPGVKTLIATRLVAAGRRFDPAPLRRALRAPGAGQRGLAALLLLQRGEGVMRARLDSLSRSEDPSRDAVRATLLRAAMRYKLNRAGPWALAVAREAGVDRSLGLMALKAAMRFGVDGARATWRRRFTESHDPARRLRLALAALEVSPWVRPGVYAPAAASDDPLIARIGQAGRAVARGRGATRQLTALIQMGSTPATRWALRFAKARASRAQARRIQRSAILSFGARQAKRKPDPRPGAARALDLAAGAARAMCEGSPHDAGRILGPMLADHREGPWVARAILLGLVRLPGSAHTPAADKPFDTKRFAQRLPTFDDPMASNLAALLRAKSGAAMSRSQWKTLGLLVQGGGDLAPGLRIQAAWAYLRRGRSEER